MGHAALLTWNGHRLELEHIRNLAERYRDADLLLASIVSNPLDATVSAWKTPALPNRPEARRAAAYHQELLAYHKHLVMDMGLHHHLVRKEWAVILNPQESEVLRCEANLQEVWSH